MNPAEVARIFKTIPETRLDLLTMAQEATDPDGSINSQQVLEQPERYERAKAEAFLYRAAANRILTRLRRMQS